MKNILITTIICAFFCAPIYAGDKSGVKKLKEQSDGSYNVKCKSKTKGIISFEEGSLCAFTKQHKNKRCEEELDATEDNNACKFSKTNVKNTCKDEYEWTVEEAAEFLCKE
jgi:hypothetical protein